MTKVIYWGTPDFAISPLQALLENGYDIVAVVTNPDEPVGRKKTLTPPPVKVFAQKNKIQVLQPEKVLDIKHQLLNIAADLYIIVAYGKIIQKEILNIPKFGALNLHPSLLPHWRGPAPIRYAMLAGDQTTGVTIIKVDEQMDHGPVIAKKTLVIPPRVSYIKLRDTLIQLGTELLITTIPRWITGKIVPQLQDETHATFSKILTKEDGRIDWLKPAEEIERMIRALQPWPGAWTTWGEKRLRIDDADITPEENPLIKPGRVWKTSDTGLFIQTGKGSIVVKILTLEGKKETNASTFIKGYSKIKNAILV